MITTRNLKVFWLAFCGFAASFTCEAQNTRGIGVYPGAAEEFFGPQLVAGDGYRNLARGRMVYQSSSFDFNMTAQLLTDGIIAPPLTPPRKGRGTRSEERGRRNGAAHPVFLDVSTPDGQLPQRQRESTIDGNDWTTSYVMGGDTWLKYAWHGATIEADKISLIGTVAYRETEATDGYRIRVAVSDDGKRWRQVATVENGGLPGKASRNRVNSDPNKNAGNDELLPTRIVEIDLPFTAKQSFRQLRVELQMKGAAYWAFTEIPITFEGRRVANLLPSSGFTSAWMVQSDRDEWACIDLGAPSEIDEIKLHWIEKPKRFEIQISDDGNNFTQLTINNQRSLAEGKSNSQFTNKNRLADQSKFKIQNSKLTARFVRVFIPKNEKPQRVILSEVEVMGRGGLVAKPHKEVGWNSQKNPPSLFGEGKGEKLQFFLDGGDWRLQRASEVTASGENISKQGFDASSWTVATVPATVLMSYVNAGALPNPNYDDNLLTISESFFNSNFWYRREFRVPQEMRGQRVFLNFDGINWKANIWLNGRKIDRIEGAFLRGKTDVTRYLNDGVNVLAVEIEKCANPGGAKLKNEQTTDFNGGILGADNPTFHATVGWDWISTIRGRDIGIWNDVYLTSTANDMTLSDPLVSSRVAIDGGDTLATMQPCVILKNYAETPITGTLHGWIGDIKFEKTVALASGEERQIDFHPADFPQLRDQKMQLWWPNGYGEPNLYDAGFSFSSNTHHPTSITYRAGIREMTYAEVDTRLQIFVNGQRFVPLGGNWGFSENNLCYRGREYDAAVRYHREMNLNCIRNWVGQIGDREFYEACDRHGIMVWQDFWLANPVDGPNPDDNEMFLKNARDYVLRIRQHPSIMLYCGRNEGYPPKAIDDGLRQLVSELTGGTPNTQHPTPMLYISSSADDGVSGHGPYWAIPAKEYFEKQTGKLHTERGMPNIMTYEGLSRTLRPEHLWPQNEFWGQHDFTQQGAQRGASFNSLISKGFGEPKDACEFTTLAQWQNYDGYRAMYESTNHDRQGLLIWMSHPTWPSMVWQTYDYYFEPTAAYFGTKKACEPLHVQWNALTDSVEIVNRTASEQKNLAVEARLFDKNGRELACEDCIIDVKSDETRPAMPIPSLTSLLSTEKVGFLRFSLRNEAVELLSENTYICAAETGNYQALKELPQAELNIEKSALRHAENGTVSCTVTLENRGRVPAVMLRLNLKAADGDQILPVIYSDNYFHLLPNEKRAIRIEWNRRDARGQQPIVEVSGYNVSLSNNRIE